MKDYKITKNKKIWVAIIALVLIVGGGGYYFIHGDEVSAQGFPQQSQTASVGSQVTIQPATEASSQVSASGNISLVDERYVALAVGGTVESIAVQVGDQVKAGDLLLTLDTTALERAARQAELSVASQRNALDQLQEAASASDIEAAQAALLEAQENLVDVQAGPSASELAAAQTNLSAAWAAYNELQAGPTDAELTQLSASLRSAEVTVAEAQTAYDQIAWKNEAGMTSEAADLQTATIAYESAKAAYEESTADPTTSDLDSALSAAQEAQSSLDDLLNSPTDAEVASAKASVATAQASLDELLNGADDSEVQELEISLEQSLIDLEQAYADLEAANVVATIDGTVLSIDASVGENVSEGSQIVALADASALELSIEVAEIDIAQVSVGQPAEIEIDAFPSVTFTGVVSRIEPASETTSGVVSYPVIIRLDESDNLDGVLPGMTAVATITDTESEASGGWMVPTSAIQDMGGTSVVNVTRGDATVQVAVTPGTVQGEWTKVQSSDLQSGDQVYATLVSTVESEDENQDGPGAAGMLGGATGGGAPPSGGPPSGGGPPGN